MPRDANVYQRPGRPRYFVVYWCPKKLKRIHVVTTWRIDDPSGYKHALRFASAKSEAASAFRGNAKTEVWNAWVPKFLNDRYRNSPLTLTRYKNAWDWLRVYLDEKQILLPRGMNYHSAIGYIDWRVEKKRHCGKTISRNTAITEIKVMGLIMREAVRRDFVDSNPCDRMGLQRDPVKEKPELTDAEVALIREECAKREAHLPLNEQWMTTSFEMALHTLGRLTSTQVPMHLVNLELGEITLRVKGRKNGEPKFLTVPIHPDLLPRLQALRAMGAAFTCTLPRMAAKEWWSLRQKLKIGHTCFHSTRVTGVSRLQRAGVPENVTMRLAGHRSPVVHRIYARKTTADLSSHLEKLKFAAPGGGGTVATAQNPGEKPATP